MHRFSDRAGPEPRLAYNATAGVAFRPVDSVGTPNSIISRLNSPACTYPCQRFTAALTNDSA